MSADDRRFAPLGVAQPTPPRPSGTTPAPSFRRAPAWTNHVERAPLIDGPRVSGEHWWDPDRLAHERDAPAFCPTCGASLDDPGAIAVEYWVRDQRTFHVRCGSCRWSGEITRVDRMLGHEAPHD